MEITSKEGLNCTWAGATFSTAILAWLLRMKAYTFAPRCNSAGPSPYRTDTWASRRFRLLVTDLKPKQPRGF